MKSGHSTLSPYDNIIIGLAVLLTFFSKELVRLPPIILLTQAVNSGLIEAIGATDELIAAFSEGISIAFLSSALTALSCGICYHYRGTPSTLPYMGFVWSFAIGLWNILYGCAIMAENMPYTLVSDVVSEKWGWLLIFRLILTIVACVWVTRLARRWFGFRGQARAEFAAEP